jgi:Flp pilus assembly pilin Flp
MHKLLKNKKSQSVLEYGLFVAVIAAALVSMGLYISRSVKANLKMVENQVNQKISYAQP